jgi:hypothetical protein
MEKIKLGLWAIPLTINTLFFSLCFHMVFNS